MTLRHMKIFIQVYQTENITQAAKLLNMTQPAVSRAIQEIEEHYGICLFERINHRLYVTEVGKQMYRQALPMMEAFENMEKGLRNGDATGIIRVGATVTCGTFLLPELVVRFEKEMPGMQVHATVSNGGNLQQALLDNQLDIALIENMVEKPEFYGEPIGGDRLLLVLPPHHPLKNQEKVQLKDLLEYPLLLREKGSTVRTFVDQYFAVQGLEARPTWESVSTQALVKAVSCGIGISILPEQLVKQNLEGGEICTREICDADLRRRYYIVWHRNKFLTGSMKEFIGICKSFLQCQQL